MRSPRDPRHRLLVLGHDAQQAAVRGVEKLLVFISKRRGFKRFGVFSRHPVLFFSWGSVRPRRLFYSLSFLCTVIAVVYRFGDANPYIEHRSEERRVGKE